MLETLPGPLLSPQASPLPAPPPTLLLSPKQATSQLPQPLFPHPHELLYLIAAPRQCKSGERKLEDSSGCHPGSPRSSEMTDPESPAPHGLTAGGGEGLVPP